MSRAYFTYTTAPFWLPFPPIMTTTSWAPDGILDAMTIDFHVASILMKLQVGSRTDAVMQAVRRGLIMM